MNLLVNENSITLNDLIKYAKSRKISIDVEDDRDKIFNSIIRARYFSMTVPQLKKYSKYLNLYIPSSYGKNKIVDSIIECYTNDGLDDVASELNKGIAKLQSEINEAEKESIIKKTNGFVDKLSVYSDIKSDNKVKKCIVESPELLKDYIGKLINLEFDKYYLIKRLIKLQIMKYDNKQKIKNAKTYRANIIKKKYDYKLNEIKTIIDILENRIECARFRVDQDLLKIDIDMECPVKPKKPKMTIPEKPQYPELKKPVLFNKKRVEEYNDRLLSEYEEAVKKYNTCKKVIDNYNEEEKLYTYKKRLYDEKYVKAKNDAIDMKTKEITDESKKELKTQNQKLKKLQKQIDNVLNDTDWLDNIPQKYIGLLIDSEIEYVKKSIVKVIKTRNELYSYNVIYKKYRNIVALSTIYEYLDSGRCYTLTGYEGAYNLFEMETRSNMIITQLNTIINSLEQIKSNQGLLYKELLKVNSNLEEINNSLTNVITELEDINFELEMQNSLLEDIQKISLGAYENSKLTASASMTTAYNTAMTAHYSKIAAESARRITCMTDSLGFINSLK